MCLSLSATTSLTLLNTGKYSCFSSTNAWTSLTGMASRRVASVAFMEAERLALSISAISPRLSPGPTSLT